MLPCIAFKFKDSVNMRDVADTVQLSAIAAEGLFGQSAVRMLLKHTVEHDLNTICIDDTNDVGMAIAKIFVAFSIREYGEESFVVMKLPKAVGSVYEHYAAAGGSN